jgi:hypothetical protein
MKDGKLTAADWATSFAPGLLTGAAFVVVAMLVEKTAIRAGAKLFGK